jgi:phosphatidylglycerophosphatase A
MYNFFKALRSAPLRRLAEISGFGTIEAHPGEMRSKAAAPKPSAKILVFMI